MLFLKSSENESGCRNTNRSFFSHRNKTAQHNNTPSIVSPSGTLRLHTMLRPGSSGHCVVLCCTVLCLFSCPIPRFVTSGAQQTAGNKHNTDDSVSLRTLENRPKKKATQTKHKAVIVSEEETLHYDSCSAAHIHKSDTMFTSGCKRTCAEVFFKPNERL